MKKISALWLLLIIVIGFYGCNLGDKEKVDSETVRKKVNPGYLNEKTGLRISSFNSVECGYLYFNYSKDGKIDYLCGPEGEDKCYFNDSNDTISGHFSESNYNSDVVYALGYNENGYLEKASISISYQEGDGVNISSMSRRGGFSFSYGDNGHLEQLSYSERRIWYSRNEVTSNFLSTISAKFVWNNNVIQRMEVVTKDNKHDSERTRKEIYNFIYDNPDYINIYGQITPFTALFLYDGLDLFTCLGWLGIGPEMLPSRMTGEFENIVNGKTESNSDAANFHYDFTGDGAVLRCFLGEGKDSWYCDFSYDYGVVK